MNNFKLVWENRDKVSLELLKKVEAHFNVIFPKEYIEIINLFDGYGLRVLGKNRKYYEPMIEVIKNREEVIEFYHYDEDELESNEDISSISIIDYHEDDLNVLPDPQKMIAFAGTAGKHHFVFDYRENEKEPAILFWDTDEVNEDAFEMDAEEYMEEYDEDIEVGKNDGFYKIADSFEEFMEKIVPFED